MTDIAEANLKAPLARFDGKTPPAPQWFDNAIAVAPQRSSFTSNGAEIELLTWGERGKPGLLLLHGSGAHADWWSFIAPFFADRYRVAAMSWSGMGRSSWRERYSSELFAQEALAASHAAGLFDSTVKPLVVGHSFGGRMSASLAARSGDHYSGMVLVDPPIFHPDARPAPPPGAPKNEREAKTFNIYKTLNEALTRFRYAPLQPSENHYITDYIARHALHEKDGGWTWRFDPNLWAGYTRDSVEEMIRSAKCPLALFRGGLSALMDQRNADYALSLMGKGAPFVTIPQAYHHVMLDQPLAFVAAVEALFSVWPPR